MFKYQQYLWIEREILSSSMWCVILKQGTGRLGAVALLVLRQLYLCWSSVCHWEWSLCFPLEFLCHKPQDAKRNKMASFLYSINAISLFFISLFYSTFFLPSGNSFHFDADALGGWIFFQHQICFWRTGGL